MVKTLTAITERSWDEAGVLLPVLVNAGRNSLPGKGFYDSLTIFRPEDDQAAPIVSARRERERVTSLPQPVRAQAGAANR